MNTGTGLNYDFVLLCLIPIFWHRYFLSSVTKMKIFILFFLTQWLYCFINRPKQTYSMERMEELQNSFLSACFDVAPASVQACLCP